MCATPLPESVQPTPSIPYNLYFHGLDKPHWSTTTDGMHPDQVAQHRAEKARALIGSARRRRAASLHDSIKRLERSITELSSLDETGLTDVAAQHIERRLAHTVAMCRGLLQDLNEATDRYRVTELEAAGEQMPESDLRPHLEEATDITQELKRRDAEDLAEREAEDLDAAADARAADQVITALAARTAPVTAPVDSFPTPADIAKGAVTPVRSHTVWPFQ